VKTSVSLCAGHDSGRIGYSFAVYNELSSVGQWKLDALPEAIDLGVGSIRHLSLPRVNEQLKMIEL
jgi:hypothetical protein